MTRPVGLRREIGEQPEVAARLLAEGRADVERLVATLRERGRPSFVLVAARGTSDHAATYAKYALGHVARLPVALAIITGRNKVLRGHLERRRWGLPVRIYGFVNEMPAMMRAADILVTKAGPGTISEAFIAGLPMVLYSKMPGQEDGNVSFVVDTGAGVWAPEPEETVEALRRWLVHPAEREKAADVCRRLARPEASRQIARILAEKVSVS